MSKSIPQCIFSGFPGNYQSMIAYMILAEYFRKSSTQIQIALYQIPYWANISLVYQALIRYYEGHTLQDSFPELTTTLQIPYNHINRRGTLPYIYIYLKGFHCRFQKLMKAVTLNLRNHKLIVCRIFHFVGELDW